MADMAEEARKKLGEWFRMHWQDKDMEIEARLGQSFGTSGFVAEISKVRWEQEKHKLDSNKFWSRTTHEVTQDQLYNNDLRASTPMEGNGSTVFLRKKVQDRMDLGYVRLQLSTEEIVPEDQAMDEIDNHNLVIAAVRIKERWTYLHKYQFEFDLTRVRQGPTVDAAKNAQPQFELEIEWKGAHFPKEQTEPVTPELLVQKMWYKIDDMLATPPKTEDLVRIRSASVQQMQLLDYTYGAHSNRTGAPPPHIDAARSGELLWLHKGLGGPNSGRSIVLSLPGEVVAQNGSKTITHLFEFVGIADTKPDAADHIRI